MDDILPKDHASIEHIPIPSNIINDSFSPAELTQTNLQIQSNFIKKQKLNNNYVNQNLLSYTKILKLIIPFKYI